MKANLTPCQLTAFFSLQYLYNITRRQLAEMLDLLLSTLFNWLLYINYFLECFFYCTVVSCKSCTELFNNTFFFLLFEWRMKPKAWFWLQIWHIGIYPYILCCILIAHACKPHTCSSCKWLHFLSSYLLTAAYLIKNGLTYQKSKSHLFLKNRCSSPCLWIALFDVWRKYLSVYSPMIYHFS